MRVGTKIWFMLLVCVVHLRKDSWYFVPDVKTWRTGGDSGLSYFGGWRYLGPFCSPGIGV